ncbi:protein transport protein Sec24A isoform X2 [Patella vulgata]|uniref:protein transport protein Sec24A isoform X2 n=1 Tax=Patella vulgata TaxID=6465 RepID=UPI00218030CB|nr:protein transport protein Sec24A isoform X2 [Patella vulgata]
MADHRQPNPTTFGSNFQQYRPPPGPQTGGSGPPQQWIQQNQGPGKMTANSYGPPGQFQTPPMGGPPRPGLPPPGGVMPQNFNQPPTNMGMGQPGTLNGHSQGNFMPNSPPRGVMNGPSGTPPPAIPTSMGQPGTQSNFSNSGMPPQTMGQRPQMGPGAHPNQQRMPPLTNSLPRMPPSMGQSTGFPPTSMGQRMQPPQVGQTPSPQMGHGPPPMQGMPPSSMAQGMPPSSMAQGMSPHPGNNQGMPPQVGMPQVMGRGMPPVSSYGQAPPQTRPPVSNNIGAPPSSFGSQQPPGPPSMINNTTALGSSDRPNELPVPYHGQAQYSHQIGSSMHLSPGVTPGSGPPSNKSSRAATPVSGQTYDALEGQFTPNKQGGPSPPQGYNPSPLASQPPIGQDMGQRSTGITGRRQYPQGAGKESQIAPNYPGSYGNKAGDQMYQAPSGIPPYGNLQSPAMPQTLPAPNSGYSNPNPDHLTSNFNKLGLNESPQNQTAVNLLNERHLIHHEGLETVKPNLQHDFKKVHCNPDVFRCTLNAMPQTSTLLNKARLPLGILIHPFKDLSQLPVIQSSVIVRCRSCRTYINPYVHFVDQRRWKCNLCYRVNDLPEEFTFDPVTKTYGDPQRRPEIRSATIEFIAPSEYMLRPPQPAVYLYLLDVSFNAIETGYLNLFCQTLLEEIDKIPGDSRTQIGFLAYDRSLYFFNLAEGLSQPQMLIVPDLDDVFLPLPDELLVNLHESKDLVIDLLNQLPTLFEGNTETGSALGAALQAGYKLTSPTGGRITVMQTVLPTVGQGALQLREATPQTSAKNIPHLGPATDFYKKLALDCSAQQVAVDLFMLNGQYADMASISCISKYSAGCIYYYPSFHTIKNTALSDKYEADLRRYLTRKIGFESVMRIRCTRGLSIHTFHGNFFVRSTDLLSLPNINPDAGFGMQMSIEDTLTECSNVCFQAALLYTSSKGERRIRVHTLCLPVTNQISDVYGSADQQAIIGLLSKMAVDRTLTSSMGDARDALMNAAVDSLGAYMSQIPASQKIGSLILPFTLRVIPLFILSLLKSMAFKGTASTKTDDRVFALQQFKVLPISYLLQSVYPHLYPVHALDEKSPVTKGGISVHIPPLIQLSSANIDRHGVYLMDTGDCVYMIVGGSVSDQFCQNVLDKPNFMSIPETMTDLPEMENPTSENLRNFVNYLLDNRPNGTTFLVMRDDSKCRHVFYQHMIEDRTESSMSYYEFLQYLQQQIK